MKTTVKLFAILASVFTGATASLADITTGWLPMTKGTYNFLDAANWANGETNGVFSADWTGSFRIFGSIAGRTLVRASNGPHTVTLDDDLYLQASSMGADFVFGNGYDDKKRLNFDLGGMTRTVFMNGTSRWIFSDRMTNGDLVFDGAGAFTFRTGGGSDGSIVLSPNMILQTAFTSSDKSDVDAVRASNLTLNRSNVQFFETYWNVTDRITGTLSVLADEPSCSILYVRAVTADKTETVRIGRLEMKPGSTLLVRGAKLGGDAKILFDTAPETVGGIVPQLIGAKSDYNKDSKTGGLNGMYDQSLVSYDAENGLVPLDLATGYADSISAASPVNLFVAYGTTNCLSGPATVNSIYLGGADSGDQFAAIMPAEGANDATLTVESGMVLIGYGRNAGNYKYPTIGVDLDFGKRRGMVFSPGGKRSQIDGAIKGSKGVTFTTPYATTETPTVGLVFGGKAGSSTYTGDTYVQNGINVGATGLLPHGERTGDVYVNGILYADNCVINGLNGKGTVNRASSGTKHMSIGDNNANGDFTGTFSVTDNASTLTKIGTGTQRFGGTVALASNGELNVNAGVVVIDGAVTQGAVNVAADAAIGGDGEIQTTLAFADGAKFSVNVADGVATCLEVTGAVTGGPVTVNANVTGKKWRDAQCILKSDDAIAASFVKGEGIGLLELRNNDTELWAAPQNSGFCVVVR